MHWLLYCLYFLLLMATDIVGLVLAAFTLPGLWLMLAGAAIYAWLTSGEFIGRDTLIVLLVLTGGSEIAEIYLGGAGAKKAGASRWGMLGGFVGGILGGFLLSTLVIIPVIGTVVGICLGSFLGAFAIEMILGAPLSQSALIGYGAAKGKLTGIVGKVGIGVAMFVITLCMALPIHLFSSSPVRAIPAKSQTTTHPATRGGI